VELKAARSTGAKPTDRVFPAIPRNSRGFLPDLDKAGIPREDDWGKRYCFHSLRVTFGTWLAQAGVAPRVHMELMRHTDMKLTMQFYTDPRLLDTTRAVGELPSLGLPVERAAAKRTGTDDMPAQVPDDFIALNRGSECPRGSTSGHFGRIAARKNPPGACKNADEDMEMVEAVGIEPTAKPSNDKDLRQSITEKSHPLADALPRHGEPPPDLARVTVSWPRLPEHIRAAILALVRTAEV